MIPQPKNKEITIGNVLSEHTFVSGTKYWKLDKVTFESVDFKVGTRVCYIDPDEEKHVEYNGNIEWIMIDERGNIEVSVDNLLIGGRVDLEDLEYSGQF